MLILALDYLEALVMSPHDAVREVWSFGFNSLFDFSGQ